MILQRERREKKHYLARLRFEPRTSQLLGACSTRRPRRQMSHMFKIPRRSSNIIIFFKCVTCRHKVYEIWTSRDLRLSISFHFPNNSHGFRWTFNQNVFEIRAKVFWFPTLLCNFWNSDTFFLISDQFGFQTFKLGGQKIFNQFFAEV